MKVKTVKSICNACVGEKNHVVLHLERQSGSETFAENSTMHWWSEHEMLKCLGCDTVSLRETHWNTEGTDEFGKPERTVFHFPPAKFRREPARLHEPSTHLIFNVDKPFIGDLVHEIYICIQNDCHRSAAMAVRALLEQVMADKVGDHGSFTNNMDQFEREGFISAKQRQFLDTAIEAGHATIHRAFKPSREDLVALVNIAESVVEAAYLNETRADQLKKGIPPRNPRNQKRAK